MQKSLVAVVSYKRPKNTTCDLLKETTRDWVVFVNDYDSTVNEYISNYGNEHVNVITGITSPNLASTRQVVLDIGIAKGYNHLIMLDDDIESINALDDKKQKVPTTLDAALDTLEFYSFVYDEMIALSASYHPPIEDIFEPVEEYTNICNNIIFNLDLYKNLSSVKYNPKSECEDMEFAIDLMLEGHIPGRINVLVINNTLQGGTTNDGLSYRFDKSNRFIKEGEYMTKRYPKLKDAFEYDDKHFSLILKKLKQHLSQNDLLFK